MHETILAAVIGAGGALAGAAITVTMPRFLDASQSAKRFVRSYRADAVKGTWVGPGDDFYTEDSSKGAPFTLRLELKVSGTEISGRGSYTENPNTLILRGGFQSDSYLQFTYQSTNPGRIQVGVIVFRLSLDGQTLTGHYAGVSPTRSIFIAGHVTLQKTS